MHRGVLDKLNCKMEKIMTLGLLIFIGFLLGLVQLPVTFWKVKVEDLKSGFDLDVKSPTGSEIEETLSVKKCLSELRKSLGKVETALKAVETEYAGK